MPEEMYCPYFKKLVTIQEGKDVLAKLALTMLVLITASLVFSCNIWAEHSSKAITKQKQPHFWR